MAATAICAVSVKAKVRSVRKRRGSGEKTMSDDAAVEAAIRERPQLTHSVRQMFETRLAKYNDPRNFEWDMDDVTDKWQRHAYSAYLDLVAVEKERDAALNTCDSLRERLETSEREWLHKYAVALRDVIWTLDDRPGSQSMPAGANPAELAVGYAKSLRTECDSLRAEVERAEIALTSCLNLQKLTYAELQLTRDDLANTRSSAISDCIEKVKKWAYHTELVAELEAMKDVDDDN